MEGFNDQREGFEKATKLIVEKAIKVIDKANSIETTKMMKAKGNSVEQIVRLMGLSKTAGGKLK